MAEHACLVGIGNPLLDISTAVPAELLERYGVLAGNAVLAQQKHLPIYSELTSNYECDFIAGGATQNSIRVAQWMSQTPGATAFFGCVGSDDYADRLNQAASRDGVRTIYQVDQTTPTGTCAVLIVDKQRSLVANIAASNKFTIEHLRANWSVIQNASFFYMAGFFLTVSPPSILEIARYASANGKTLAMGIAAPFIIEFFKDPMMELFPYVDYVFGNQDEAQKFSQVHGFDTSDHGEIAKRMAEFPKENDKPRIVVITRGKDSVVVATGGEVQYFDVPLLEQDQIMDLNGAGDAFVGGFLSRLIKGMDLETCVRAGNYASREVIQKSGCTFPEVPEFN